MRVIVLKTLKVFYLDPRYRDSEQPILSWYQVVKGAIWSNPNDIKNDFGNVSILQDGRVVFNIGGNKYRLVAWMNYHYKIVYIKFVGTHSQYNHIDSQTIQGPNKVDKT